MMVELIPKQERKPIFGQVFFLIISLALLVGVVAGFVILRQFIGNTREELATLEQTLAQDTRPLEEELSAKLRTYKKKADLFGIVLNEKRTTLPFLGLLEATTHPDVFFRDLSGNAETGAFVLTGAARNFFVLEQQRLVWNRQTEFQKQLTSIRLGEAGTGEFTVEFAISPELLKPL